nr:MAG TPA: hypothetical protein [Caudoviricetes sp.]
MTERQDVVRVVLTTTKRACRRARTNRRNRG